MRRVLIVVVAMALVAPAGLAATPQSRTVDRSRDEQRSVERGREQQRTVERSRDQRRRDDRVEEVERTTRTLNLGADGEINVSNISGDMVVTRGGGNSATVEIIKTARAETAEDAKMLLGMVTVEVMERGPRAEIETRYPSDDDRGGAGAATCTSTSTSTSRFRRRHGRLHSISGSLTVRDISGALALDTISGNIKLANTGRVATAKTIRATSRWLTRTSTAR